jgi:hypothetical protein
VDDRRARTETIEDFAATLRELRNSVGNPPFREMSGRSGAISHTTLHEATKGNRLPSWETTIEFVKACGADPGAYRERWERANRAVRSADQPSGAPTDTAEPGHAQLGEVPAPVVPEAGSRRRLRPALLAAAVVSLGVVALVVTIASRGSEPEKPGLTPSAGASIAALSQADCPVHPTNPPPASPAHRGDAARFVADVTLADCTLVGAGETVTKVWRLKNVGTVPWNGYSLRRLDPTQADHCQTIPEVPIKDTKPGETVDIRADITTPRKPGLCYVRFKMVDASGTVVFPGNRPVYFQIIVGEP